LKKTPEFIKLRMLDNWSGMPLGRELEPRERESLTGRKKTMKTRYFIFFCGALLRGSKF